MKLQLGHLPFGSKKLAKNYVKSVVESLIGWEVRETNEHFKLDEFMGEVASVCKWCYTFCCQAEDQRRGYEGSYLRK